jgi:hypothetical protein
MLTGIATTRYDDTTFVSWWKGNRANMQMRFMDGNWRTPQISPFNTSKQLRTANSDSAALTGNYYGIIPLVLTENTGGYVNTYGELDGIFQISGFSNTVENTLTVAGDTYLVLRDVYNTGFMDFTAIRLT